MYLKWEVRDLHVSVCVFVCVCKRETAAIFNEKNHNLIYYLTLTFYKQPLLSIKCVIIFGLPFVFDTIFMFLRLVSSS